MGTGINKIKTLLKENGNYDPVFKFDSFYTIILKRIKGGIKGTEELLLKTIIIYPGKRTNELAEILEISERTMEKWIKNLRNGDKIVFKGSKKTGGYFAKEDINLIGSILR